MNVRFVLWVALLVAPLLDLVVLATITQTHTGDPPDLVLVLALAGASCATAVVSFVLPAVVRARSLRALGLETRPAEPFGDVPAGTPVFVDPDGAREKARPALQTAMILALALRESIALNGFVLGMLGAPKSIHLPFFGVSIVLLALGCPRASEDDAALEAAYGARLR